MSFFELGSDKAHIKRMPDIDTKSDILLCDYCGNTVLVSYHDKMMCPTCLHIYEPNWEFLKHADQEGTIDDIGSNKGAMDFVNDDPHFKPRLTLNRKKLEEDEDPDYIKKDREYRYRNSSAKLVKVTKG